MEFEAEMHADMAALLDKIYDFISRFYRDSMAGRNSEVYSEEEFPFSENFRNFLKIYMRKVLDRNLVEHLETLIPLNSEDRLRFLREQYEESFRLLGDHMSDRMFVQWTVVCCFSAFQYAENGIVEAPDAAKTYVREICMEEMYYTAFIDLGCNMLHPHGR